MFDRFRGLSQVQQIVLISGLVAVCCGILVAIWLLFVRVSYQPLFTDLRPADAATVVAELDRKKVPFRLSNGGTTISVPADRVEVTRLNVTTQDLPLKGTVGFELFNKTDMGLTEFAQKINYIRAIQGELERTILTLDGVEAARVHVSMGEDRVSRDDQVPPKASVTIRMAKRAALDAGAVRGVQRIIAAAVPKLEISNVVVLDEEGRIISPVPVPEKAAEVLVSPAAQQKLAVEQFYGSRIRQALEQAYPGADIQVRTTTAISVEGVSRVLAAWNPNAREFPLQVTLSSTHSLDENTKNGIRGIAANAIGVNPARGDLVEFGTAEQASEAEPEPEPRPALIAPKVQDWPRPNVDPVVRSWYWDAPYVLVPLIILGAIALLLRVAQRPRRLSDAQRAAFTARLQRTLEGRADSAAT